MKTALSFSLLLLLLGCQEVTQEVETEIVSEEEVIVKEFLAYPSVEDYMASIIFKDGTKLTGDPYKDIYLQTDHGIERFNLGIFYEENELVPLNLETKKEYLATVLWRSQMVEKTASDPMYDFVQERNQIEADVAFDYEQKALENKKLLEQLNQKKKNLSVEEFQKLILLAEENGDYAKVQALYEIQCEKDPSSCKEVVVNLTGWVKNDAMEVAKGAKIHVLNDPSREPFSIEESGEYAVTFKARPNQLLRLRYTALGHMPLVKEVRLGPIGPEYDIVQQVRLPKSDEIKILSTEVDTIIETEWGSVYDMTDVELKDAQGSRYTGDFQAFLYDFDPWEDDMGEILRGSVRVQGGVVPQMVLQSFGMAYVSFVTPEGEMLRISKQNPATVTSILPTSRGYYEEYKMVDETEEEFWEYWVKYSQENGAFMGSQHEREIPSYWVYNIHAGIWEEVPFQVIESGVINSIFYTHN